MRFLILLVCCCGAFAQWTQFRGNPTLTGVLPAGSIPKTLKLLWTYEAGESIESSAAIVDGAVFFGTQAGGTQTFCALQKSLFGQAAQTAIPPHWSLIEPHIAPWTAQSFGEQLAKPQTLAEPPPPQLLPGPH